TAARRRLEAKKTRTDMREWALKRRARTHHLIELGGLVMKAGLVELADDDSAALYGAFLAVAEKLGGEDRERTLTIWKRKGRHAFETEAGTNSASRASNTRAEGG
ncbi:MAG: conjugal transfer protein TraD, partial [Methylocystis sp.]